MFQECPWKSHEIDLFQARIRFFQKGVKVEYQTTTSLIHMLTP